MANKEVAKMKVADLKRELEKRGLKVTGIKKELAERLQSALRTNKNKRRAKKAKIDGHCKAIIPHVEQPPYILKLPVEILEYIFDYLDLCDLCAVGKTCKWMQQVTGGCYKQNYAGRNPGLTQREGRFYIDFYYFIQFFDKFRIMEHGNRRPHSPVFYKFITLQSELHQLEQLAIHNVDFRIITVDSLEGVLRKLDHLRISKCEMGESFLENILAVAPNIKRLSLMDSGTGKQWLTRSYPTLEHCDIDSHEVMPIAIFLRLNPNIRKFGTNLMNLWENRYFIQTSEIKLDDLAISVEDSKLQFGLFCQLLNELFQIGFYKRLKFFISFIHHIFNQNEVEEMANLTAFVKLYVQCMVSFNRVALSDLVHLGDLSFADSRYITDIETIATRLNNLERIHFGVSILGHVKLFMSKNLKLEIIEINWFIDDAGNIEKKKVLNLFELNKIRAKLPNAKKITLYVDEDVYLATKRSNRETDLEFVKLKRIDTYNERAFDFTFNEYYHTESCYRP